MGQEGHRLRRAVAGASVVALAAAMGLLMGSAAASAAVRAISVNAVVGSAYGYHAYGITLFGGAQPEKGPSPIARLTKDASNSPQSAATSTGIVTYGPAVLFTSDSMSMATSGSLGTSGSVTSSSDVSDINKASTEPGFTGSEALTADSITSSCSATTSAVSGSTSVTNGSLVTNNGTNPPTKVNIPTSPTPNYAVTGKIVISPSDTEKFRFVFNEQVKAGTSIIVNAVHEYFLGPTQKGNLIIGQVICSTAGTDVSLQNTPITHSQDPVPSGGTVTFTITVSNLGPNSALKVLDASSVTGGRISGATASAGTCAMPKLAGSMVTCNLGTIASGQSVTVLVSVTAPVEASGSISINSTVSCPAEDDFVHNSAGDNVSVS